MISNFAGECKPHIIQVTSPTQLTAEIPDIFLFL